MKIVVEKTEANLINFDAEKRYLVLDNFDGSRVLGICTISVEGGIMYADLVLNKNVKGYPAVGYIKDTETNEVTLKSIGICESQNFDHSIESINYVKEK